MINIDHENKMACGVCIRGVNTVVFIIKWTCGSFGSG